MEIKEALKNSATRAGIVCLIIGLGVGLLAAGGDRGGRGNWDGDRDGFCGGDCVAGECEGCGEAGGGCPMMKEGGGMMGMHQMLDGSMMANRGGSGDMGSMMMDMAARLEGKTGDALDKVFLEDMIVHHQGAVDMAKLLAAGSNRPEMQKFAADIIRVQSAEIEQMEAWEKSWFGN